MRLRHPRSPECPEPDRRISLRMTCSVDRATTVVVTVRVPGRPSSQLTQVEGIRGPLGTRHQNTTNHRRVRRAKTGLRRSCEQHTTSSRSKTLANARGIQLKNTTNLRRVRRAYDGRVNNIRLAPGRRHCPQVGIHYEKTTNLRCIRRAYNGWWD